jgi:uncharacterized protein YecA (UPF0149 family)
MIDKKLLEDLNQCLNGIVANDEHFGIDQLRGLFYAQTITPDNNALMGINSSPSDWLSALFYDERPTLDEAQIAALNTTVGAVYEAYHALFARNQLSFPFQFTQLDADSAEAAYAWCQGFFIGLSVNDQFWLGEKGERLKIGDKELEAVRNSARLFTGLVNQDFADFDKVKLAELKAFVVEQGQEPTDDVLAATLFPNVPNAVKSLQNYGTKSMRLAGKKIVTPTGKKIGRNEPCHCGSGKKYKKCCGA